MTAAPTAMARNARGSATQLAMSADHPQSAEDMAEPLDEIRNPAGVTLVQDGQLVRRPAHRGASGLPSASARLASAASFLRFASAS